MSSAIFRVNFTLQEAGQTGGCTAPCLPLTVEQHRLVTVVMDTTRAGPWIWNSLPEDTQSRCWQHLVDTWNYIYADNLTRILCRSSTATVGTEA